MAAEIIKRQQALCLTGTPPTFPSGVWHVAVQLSLSRWGKWLRYDCCHSTPRCPTPSCDWAYMVIYTPPPPLPAPCVPFPHSCPAWMQECLVSPPVEKVSGVLIALWCVYKCVRVRACEFIVQLSVCTAAGLSVTA